MVLFKVVFLSQKTTHTWSLNFNVFLLFLFLSQGDALQRCWGFEEHHLVIKIKIKIKIKEKPLQSKLAWTSAARRLKLWHWTLPTHDQSRLITKSFLTQTDLPTSAVSSVEMEELTWTSRAVSTRPEIRSIWWIRYGVLPPIVLVPSWSSIIAASLQPSCMAQNVGA